MASDIGSAYGQNKEQAGNDGHHRTVCDHHDESAEQHDKREQNIELRIQIAVFNRCRIIGERRYVIRGIFSTKGRDAFSCQLTECVILILLHRFFHKARLGKVTRSLQ